MSDKPIVEVTPTAIIYRASALGSCLRALYAARTGYDPLPPPKKLQEAFDQGHELEPMILAQMEQAGWTLEQPQAAMHLHVGTIGDREVYVVGHVDCLGTPPNGEHWMPVDAKAFAASTMADFMGNGILTFPHYSWQQSAYAEGFAVNKFCLALWNKDTNELTIKVYETHPHSFEDIQDRVLAIEAMVAAKIDITEIDCPARWGCPYHYLHDPAPVPDAIPDDLIQLVINYNTAKIKEATFKAAKDTLGKLILAKLPYTEDHSTFTGNGLAVSVVPNSKRFNQQKAKELLTEAGLDLEDYYLPGQGNHIVVKEKP